jgi:hypothetical protein
MMLAGIAGPLPVSTVLLLALAGLLSGCSAAASAAHAETPTDPIDELPPGPLVVLPIVENDSGSTGETSYFVTFRDSTGGEHALTLSFTSYPIVVTAVTLDGKSARRGASWARLGRRLVSAFGQANNVTILLRCFGGDTEGECYR